MSAWTNDARLALYYAPPYASAWWQAGSEWLGRDAESGQSIEPPRVPALAQPVASLTMAPRRYGWHGTLVPPFHMAEGCTQDQVVTAARAWAKKISPFNVPMQAAEMDRFVALRAAQPEHDEVIRGIAASALHALASLRACPSHEDTQRRLASSLNARQLALLHEWGYPYVLDEFRFHMTLSDSIDSAPLRAAIRKLWQARSESLGPLPFHGAALFVQRDRAAPFFLWQRLPFGDAGESE
ncbi:phosphonate metabolism protein [Paraburkholderia strydomiana]|nr:phosphonate metabolism protein [Paraburkholderia strydomiana]